MILEVYIVLFLTGIYFLKLGIIDRKAEIFSFMFSFILFGITAFSSFSLQIYSAELITLLYPVLFGLFFLLAIISFVLVLLSALGKLPEGRIDYDNGRRT